MPDRTEPDNVPTDPEAQPEATEVIDTDHSLPKPGDDRRRSLLLIIGIAVAVLAAVVVVAVLLTPRGSGPDQGGGATSGTSTSKTPTSSDTPDPSGSATDSPAATPTPGQTVPVPIDDTVDVQPGIAVSLAKLESVAGEANGPGEVAGPSVRVTVRIVNSGSAAAALDGALVTVAYGADSTPASPLSGPGVVNFPASVAAGATVDAVFVFAVPTEERGNVAITFDYSAASPIIVFTGAVPA